MTITTIEPSSVITTDIVTTGMEGATITDIAYQSNETVRIRATTPEGNEVAMFIDETRQAGGLSVSVEHTTLLTIGNLVALGDRQLATVLAALRHWQRALDNPAMPPEYDSIAADDGTITPLTIEEIETLCERLT